MNFGLLSDVFRFRVDVMTETVVTRRNIISVISSMYDLLGLVGSHVLLEKLIIQEATRLKIDLNQPVPSTLSNSE